MSLATLKKTIAFFIAWMKVETKAKCDGELPSNFEIKSKFSKQWWNEAEIHLQNYKWNQNFRNSSKIWRWIAFEDRNKNKYIMYKFWNSGTFCRIASKILCKIFPTGYWNWSEMGCKLRKLDKISYFLPSNWNLPEYSNQSSISIPSLFNPCIRFYFGIPILSLAVLLGDQVTFVSSFSSIFARYISTLIKTKLVWYVW